MVFVVNHKDKASPVDSLNYILSDILEGGGVINAKTVVDLGDRQTYKSSVMLAILLNLLFKEPNNAVHISPNLGMLRCNIDKFREMIKKLEEDIETDIISTFVRSQGLNVFHFVNGSSLAFSIPTNNLNATPMDILAVDCAECNFTDISQEIVKDVKLVYVNGCTQYPQDSLLAKLLHRK